MRPALGPRHDQKGVILQTSIDAPLKARKANTPRMHTETAPHACLQLSLLHICLQKARCRARARVRNDWLGPLGPQQSKGSARFTPQPRGDTQRWMVGVVSSILGSTPAAAHQWGILVSKPGAPKPPCSQRPHWSTKVCLCHGSHLEIRGACLCKFAGMGALYMSIRQFTVICRLCGYAS